MKSLWNDEEAARYNGDLAQRVYASRLLGRDRSLVLHGGGNTSIKIRETNILGEEEDILYVKGSGWDLESIEEAGFSPVRLLGLATLDTLSDTRMATELKSNMTNAGAPAPSVEAILHAILPYKYVDHTQADALIAVTNTPGGLDHIREIYGDTVVAIPYLPAYHRHHCARHFAGRIPGAPGSGPLRCRVLGPRTGHIATGGRATPLHGRSRPGVGRGLGHR